MDIIIEEAMTTLDGVISAYLPAVSSANVSRDLFLLSKRVKPTGLGGFVGMHPEPNSELFGRYIEADAEISVSANATRLNEINDAVQAATQALLANDRQTLRQDGIFSIELVNVSPPESDVTSSGDITRTARFSIRYEYIKIPDVAGGVIDELVIHQQLSPSDNRASFVYEQDFSLLAGASDPLADFLVVTDSNVNASSPNARWEYNLAEQRIEQLNNVRGGGLRANVVRKAGAQLLIQPGQHPLNIQDFSFEMTLSSEDSDGLGAVFRWQNVDNFHFFLMSARHNYHLLGKKVAGSFEFFSMGHLNETVGFTPNSRHIIKLLAVGSQVQVSLDGVQTLLAEDHDLTNKGQLGFLTHGNSNAHFHHVNVIAYDA